MALGQACLTILTLGLWRFWMTTRLRRYYFSSVRIMGDPFEYTGNGLEKLIGYSPLEMARPERFELPTPRFEAWCSIQLSYGRWREG